jgi:hypothetical protein
MPAGIQVLNTGRFPGNKGPLAHVHLRIPEGRQVSLAGSRRPAAAG